MIILGDDRVLAFGLFPDGAVSAEAVSPNGERVDALPGFRRISDASKLEVAGSTPVRRFV